MISEGILLKQLGILIISAVKFLLAAPASYLLGYSYLHTLFNTTAGGLFGVVFFFFLSRSIFRLYRRYSPGFYNFILRTAGVSLKMKIAGSPGVSSGKKFTRINRLIIRIRRSYGFPGIVILTPVILSIPLGTFLALKYYSSKRNVLAWLSLSVIAWAVVLTTFMEIL